MSLVLREVPRLRVLENRLLWKIFGLKRDNVIGKWRTVHNDENHKPCISPNTIRAIISRRIRWARHMVCMGKEEVYT